MTRTAVVEGAKTRLRRIAERAGSLGSEENRKKYDRLAGAYYSPGVAEQARLRVLDGQLALVSGERVRSDVIAALLRKMKAAAPASILEVGSGDGNNFPHLRAAFPTAELHGVDISPRRVEFARTFHESRGLKVNWSVASATALPFKDASIDAVFSMFCLEHLPREFPEAIREMLRVAKQRVFLVEPIPEYRGALQRVYALALDYLRGLPKFLEHEGIAVESIELLNAAANPLNMGTLVVLVPKRREQREAPGVSNRRSSSDDRVASG